MFDWRRKFNLDGKTGASLSFCLFCCRCKTKTYPELLPTTSVVIVFHNEAWTTLLRTIHSIILRSPRDLLEEIILVDDASEQDHLGKQLEDYVATLSVPVHVFRTGTRSGMKKIVV